MSLQGNVYDPLQSLKNIFQDANKFILLSFVFVVSRISSSKFRCILTLHSFLFFSFLFSLTFLGFCATISFSSPSVCTIKHGCWVKKKKCMEQILQGDKKKALAHTIIYIYFVNFLPHQYVSFSIQILINVHENKEETQGQIVLKLCDFF